MENGQPYPSGLSRTSEDDYTATTRGQLDMDARFHIIFTGSQCLGRLLSAVRWAVLCCERMGRNPH
ncbi:hypothetical protein GCM10025857_10370 [Alicyclobacillus contaminans]|nr:hypothetical protein GCM10025857_10370 [Alicyclobacillus contaminans]